MNNKFLLNLKFFPIYFFPLSICLGSAVVNLMLICSTLIVIINFKKFFEYIKKNNFFIFLIFFFLYILVLSLGTKEILKGIGYLRYLFFFLLVYEFSLSKERLKYFYITLVILLLFLSVDIFFQRIFGSNIFGMKFSSSNMYSNRFSGFFGDELIAGSFLFKMSFILLFFFLFKKNKSINLLFSLIFFLAILITGERMSFINYFVFLIALFYVSLRTKYFYILFSSIVLFFVLAINFDDNSRHRYNQILYEMGLSDHDYNISFNKDTITKRLEVNSTPHLSLYKSSIIIIKEKPILGHGIKGFRDNCKAVNQHSCSSHPHNYYFEIATSFGIIGLFIFILTLYFMLKNISNIKKSNKIAILIFFLLIINPLQTTGSIFSTITASMFWFNLGILIPHFKLNYEKNY